MMVEGGCVGVFVLIEFNVGLDVVRVVIIVIIDEEIDEYVLNGIKCFIFGGG